MRYIYLRVSVRVLQALLPFSPLIVTILECYIYIYNLFILTIPVLLIFIKFVFAQHFFNQCMFLMNAYRIFVWLCFSNSFVTH
jgi:hypothetical protein